MGQVIQQSTVNRRQPTALPSAIGHRLSTIDYRLPSVRLSILSVLVGGFGLLACAGDSRATGSLRGTRLAEPWPKPEFTLTGTDGRSFDFRRDTEGYVTLLFFGYTHCPDICPVHMANLGAVLHKLPPGTADQVRVVFVTTDPERDTPERLREWLDNFDPRFIGLAGSLDSVNAIQRRIGLAPAMRIPGDGDHYTMGHAAQIIAYTKDDLAHVVYPFGTRQEDWAHDLPILITGNR